MNVLENEKLNETDILNRMDEDRVVRIASCQAAENCRDHQEKGGAASYSH